MDRQRFSFWNRITGGSVFGIALTTFWMTVEPTASFWDCAEYIATSAKLQIGHPPGAPFFQMMGAFFSIFASSPENIAYSVNLMSVFSSAFTILFLYLTLSLLLRKLPNFQNLNDPFSQISFFGSAALGALAFCFSDSFWFNAVEAEVYAMATCLLALLFWLGLRWEADMDEPYGDRWLLLIAFVIGLSFGVHFMGLLTIPAIGMIYYFKKFPHPTLKGFLLANILSVAVLLFIFKLLLPLTLAFFGESEVFFVNTFGMPFNSGTIIAGIIILSIFIYLLRLTRSRSWIQSNTLVLCTLFLLLGFSSWIMIPIRANANTVINENNPADARQLLAYYNLEQYPETHLFYGPMFSDIYAGQDELEPYVDEKPKYEQDAKTGKYVIVNNWENARINSNARHRGLLPRLWSTEHAGNYMNFTQPLDFQIAPQFRNSEALQKRVNEFRQEAAEGLADGEAYHQFFKTLGPYLEIEKPSFWSNLQFLFNYQVSYMYWRYFMWNFAGRQNDIQGDYTVLSGNWLSGIPFIDEIRLGNQDQLPSDALNNKARNTYYMLPLLLGLVGFYFLYTQDPKRFWVLLLFFLFTGLALKVYLNERPFEPRERDYALVGSFYVFSIWIGMGAFALAHKAGDWLRQGVAKPAILGLCFLAVPLLMAAENWDDHDRSNRFTAQAVARGYLSSIQEDVGAMIFSIGDNDTFALWYAQDIEGYRTDVRTINTSLFATDWYIDQMKRKTYKSEPIPSQIPHSRYVYGTRDYIKYEAIIDSVRWDIKDFVNWVSSDHPRTKYKTLILQSGGDPNQYPKGTQEMVYYPTNKLRIPVNKKNVLESGLVKAKDADLIVPYIDIDLPESGITKNQMMMLDIIANNDWKRPIYFTGGSYEASEYIWMKEYLELEGLVYKLVPIRTELSKNNPYLLGRLDSDRMYAAAMNWDWGNSQDPAIYHDPETRKNSITYRSNLARLSEQLINEGEEKKAMEIIDLAIEKMPIDYFGYYSLLVPFVDGYYRLGAAEKARKLSGQLAQKHVERLNYFNSLSPELQYNLGQEIITDIERFRTVLEATLAHKDRILLQSQIDLFVEAIEPFSYLYGDFDFYAPLRDVAEGYYWAQQPQKAQALLSKIADAFEGRMEIYAGISEKARVYYMDRIKSDIIEFRRVVFIAQQNDTARFGKTLEERFNRSLSFMTEEEFVGMPKDGPAIK
ncbi:MAG: DUF2723 domain-containing protein [Flavobacteriaceae bacterium]